MLTSRESLKNLKRIFLPAILLSVLLAAASSLLLSVENCLLLDFERLPHLTGPIFWTQISVGFLMLGFSIYWGKSFEKIFRASLLGSMGWILLIASLLIFGTQSSIERLENCLYVTLKLFRFDFFSFLIWGFLLRLTPVSLGKKYFISLAALIYLSGEWIRLDWLFAKALQKGFYTMCLLSIPQVAVAFLLLLSVGCMAAALLVFNTSGKKLSQDPILSEEPEPTKTLRFPFFSAALLLLGCSVMNRFFALIWKSEIRSQMSTPETSQKISYYLSYTDLAATTLTLSLAFLGSWLIRRSGWKKTAVGASSFIWIGAIGLFTFIGASPLSKILSYSLFASSAKALFFPLVQMLYLYLPSQNRFATKIATEMILLLPLASLSSFAAQALIVALGSIAAAAPWLKQFAIGIAMLMVYAARRASKYSDSAAERDVQNS